MWEKSGVVGELTGSLIICCQGGVVDRNRFADGTLLDNIKSPRLFVFSRLVLLACHIEPGIRYGIFDLPCDINLALLRIFPSQSSR
ncbi:Poly(ADP-ribose) glycohydrolase [Fusarium oxysporum f. sp. albedinis]|nr:Poly(ADP-ribose) glycohydrolase [Fusarium oxysporum f. sp. albedinis]